MAADWSALAGYLRGSADTVTLTWPELEDIVGGMPASALDHPAWWSGDRPHTRAWKSAGFTVTSKRPGVSVTFRRIRTDESRTDPPVADPTDPIEGATKKVATGDLTGRLLLIACGKAKASQPSAAKDLYVSPRFRKARSHAERSGVPWFILSAEHGLVSPDEWLAPYERYLPTTPRDYRIAWGEWVAARLDLLAGPLTGRIVEVHACEAYLEPLTAPLTRRGARIERPLQGLTSGRWQTWYDAQATSDSETTTHDGGAFVGDPQAWIACLGEEANSVLPADLPSTAREVMDGPGLYSWFVDGPGADDLSRGLQVEISPGLVYVGQTGATKWPSGKPSEGRLVNRIRRQHLAGRRSSSTLRRTLGAILDAAMQHPVSREELTAWMFAHLRVVTAITPDAASLGDLERQVVQALNPPLNLDHVGPSPARAHLKRLRAATDDTIP
ncbi:DUF6884 domain-containing protein [Nocardioides ferulae]|uniref:DUF6884 domain-containing protein n=1 Tax=Nocardioides ferulae TaxID=2340821 RepID=UPI000EB49A09|nr:DUF6884 domain-containing protein [Nocardioides ferulae]